jgi:hypothetical protein
MNELNELINILDIIIKPFQTKLEILEKIYEDVNKNKSISIPDIQGKMKQLLFKETKQIITDKRYDYAELSKKKPIHNSVIDFFDLNKNEELLYSDVFHKKIVEYRLLEIQKIILTIQQLVIIYLFSSLELQNDENDQDITTKYKNIFEDKIRILNTITEDSNIVKFKKNYCKFLLYQEVSSKLNK